MSSFFERLQQKIANEPNRVILRSENYPDGITYQQLDEDSGRVCHYLKNRNIGKEDFVMVLLPREASAYISVIGIWKSGAAMILLEEDYSPERVSYIKDDLHCKLVITKDVFTEMMSCECANSFELPQIHDACYAAYTSGSTGNPKGILHEFGKLDLFDYDYNGKLLPLGEDERFAIVTPLNFGPSLRNAVTALLYGKCIYIVPKNSIKNPIMLLRYFNENKITETSVTCSFFKAYSFATQYMKNVFVHSEPCTGVYQYGVNVINLYTLSEVVFPIFTFRIEEPSDNAPLGYANNNVKIAIVNENADKTKPYEVGEIIVADMFTRGYINLPKTTADAFREGWFHTGDFGYYDENEMAFLCGRKDDMIKINGNRIEPLEIEAAVKKALQIKHMLAKGFADEGRSFIAAYLLRDELQTMHLLDGSGNLRYTPLEMKDKLRNRLPEYMIPSYYLVLDAYPTNENGKLSRKNLQKPNAGNYVNPFEVPQNETEAYFCRLFEKVLNLERVGAADDFYQIGGDSLSSMMAVAQCDRYELTVSELYQARTPRNLSAQASVSKESECLDSENRIALTVPQPLLAEQKVTFESQMRYPEYNINHLTRLFRLKNGVDITSFRKAVDRVFRHHPVFSSVLVNDNGIEKIAYKPELYKNTEMNAISSDELKERIDKPCELFQMEDNLLYRHAVYQCGDVFYFYLDIHHLITDGTSLKNLFHEIERCYYDEFAFLPPDYCFLLLQQKAEASERTYVSPQEIRQWYCVDPFLQKEYNSIKADGQFFTLIPSKFEHIIDIEKNKVRNCSLFKIYKGNVFFLTCFLKTMAAYNHQDKAFTFWVYSGREQRYEKDIHCMLIKTMPMGLTLAPSAWPRQSFDTVKKAVDSQIANGTAFVSGITDDFMFTPYFVYQQDVLHTEKNANLFDEQIEMQGGCTAFEFHLIDNAEDTFFRCEIKYAAGYYCPASLQRFCKIYEQTINDLIR